MMNFLEELENKEKEPENKSISIPAKTASVATMQEQ